MAQSDSTSKEPVKVNQVSTILTSDWTGMNPNLIAKFYPVKRLSDGGWSQSRESRTVSQAEKYVVDDAFEVHAPITDCTMDMTLNWQSPFEGAGAESKAPTLSAMLQSGSLQPTVAAFDSAVGTNLSNGGAGATLNEAVGRTGITKLNSTQTFSGMPPVSFTLTAHFRALVDPRREVRDPITQLEEWAAPQYLAPDGVIANAIKNGTKESFVQTTFPSEAPQIIAFQYADRLVMPLVIESVSEPITVPRSFDGFALTVAVQMKLCSLTAWERRDFKRMYTR
ncbi:hypothetical protein [Cupriavidus pauculus]|uniref:hypothetical protein n=1 Tax=Cupriavidus pauculus TaxID=82633 RepID=UPI001D0C8A38|nr:hypothetical protein [Cupriavidus pauculus]